MKKHILFISLLFLGIASTTQAQQDAMFTKYMFNPMNYNPAYAGSAGATDMLLLHRQQWWGIQGGPMTQQFNIHSPIKDKNIGIGLNMALDQVANSRDIGVFGSFAYRIPLNSNNTTHLAIGMQGGVNNWYSDFSQLELENPNDPAFQNQTPNLWLPNFGAGIYLHSEKYFLGLSAPRLITNSLQTQDIPNALSQARQYRHYYLAGGLAIGDGDFVFRPSFLVKNVGLFLDKNGNNFIGSPNEFDIDLALLFNQMFWVGVSFRSAFELGSSSYDSVDFWVSLRMENGLRIGAAYDYTLTDLQGPAQGSYEILLGYDLIKMKSKNYHPRYF